MKVNILFFSAIALTIFLILLIALAVVKRNTSKKKTAVVKSPNMKQNQNSHQDFNQNFNQNSDERTGESHSKNCLSASDLSRNTRGINTSDWSSMSKPYLQQYKVTESEYKRLLDKYGPQYFEKLSQYNYDLAPYLYPGVYPPKAGPLNQFAFNQPYLIPPPLNYQMPPPGFGQNI